MTEFILFCNKIIKLQDNEIELVSRLLKRKEYRKGTYLLKREQVCSNLIFIESGIVKMSKKIDDKEFIMRFFSEREMFTVLNSFLEQSPSEYQLVAIENTLISYLSYNDLNTLIGNSNTFETFFRKLQSKAILKMMNRISELLVNNPAKRYQLFLKDNHNILNRISLGDIASYVGISQVSLSRIRARR